MGKPLKVVIIIGTFMLVSIAWHIIGTAASGDLLEGASEAYLQGRMMGSACFGAIIAAVVAAAIKNK